MTSIPFPEANFFFPAKDEKNHPTSLHFYKDPQGFVVSCWEPTAIELSEIMKHKKIFLILPLKEQISLSIMTRSPFSIPGKEKKGKIVGLDGKPLKG